MSKIVDEVVAANAAYVRGFGKKGDLPLPPARQFAILTCMDARLDPAKYAGLAEGDAHVIRNAGGRATDDAIRSLVISHKLLGTQEWFVIHHTNCGMELFSDEVIADLLEDDLSTATLTARPGRIRITTGGTRPATSLNGIRSRTRRQRHTGRASHSGASAGSRKRARLWLCVRRPNRTAREVKAGAGGRAAA